jgi:hypothetical protein
LTVAPLQEARALRASGAGTPPWLPFALLAGLGLTAFIFGLFRPELIAAILGEG